MKNKRTERTRKKENGQIEKKENFYMRNESWEDWARTCYLRLI